MMISKLGRILLPLLLLTLLMLVIIAYFTNSPASRILTAVALLTSITILHLQLVRRWKTAHFICTCCHKPFKPSLIRSLFASDVFNKRLVTCTHCGKKDYMAVLEKDMKAK